MWFTHLGHAAVLVEHTGSRVLFDPGTVDAQWHGTTNLDAVVITHVHPDHLDTRQLPALLEANPDARILAETSAGQELDGLGVAWEVFAPGDTTAIGSLRLTAHGGEHAVIHPELPLAGNIGVLVSSDGEPTFFHPGDSYAVRPAGVDVLALPLAAPWAALVETVDFVRAVAPRVAFPVHDGILSAAGRGVFLRNVTALAGTDVRDIAGVGEVEVSL